MKFSKLEEYSDNTEKSEALKKDKPLSAFDSKKREFAPKKEEIAKQEEAPLQSEPQSLSVPSQESSLPEEKREVIFSIKKQPKERKHSNISVFEDGGVYYKNRAREVYSTALEISSKLMIELRHPYAEKYAQIEYICSKILKELKDNPLFQGYISYITPGNYLYSHNVNVAIISMGCALSLNYENSKIIKTGIAAFLHDIGLLDFMDLIKQERRFSEVEKQILHSHSLRGVEYLEKIADIDMENKDFIADMIMKVHERFDGSGYPNGLSGDNVDENSSVIAAADVYESLSHKRNWREALEPAMALKYFLEEGRDKFHPKAIKALVSFLGIYPPNSLVKLSTGEIGEVALVNKKNLTRPVVEVFMDEDYKPVAPFYIDLVEYPLTSIENELYFSELAKNNASFLSDYEMKYFWLDWD